MKHGLLRACWPVVLLLFCCSCEVMLPEEVYGVGGSLVGDGLVYRARTELVGYAPLLLEATVTVTNAMPVPRRVEYGDCALRLHVYDDEARTGAPVWRSEDRRTPEGRPFACKLYLAVRTLSPGEHLQAEEFRLRVPVYEVLADSLPSGRYYFSAQLELNQEWTPEMPAGEAELTAGAEPLPEARTADGVRYGAEMRPVAPPDSR